MRIIAQGIETVGVDDHGIDLFEGQYAVPRGMTYNSYLIKGEKTAVTDTVDGRFVGEWLNRLAAALGGTSPDFLIIHHMEPDHSAGIKAFAERYPSAGIVGNAKTFAMLEEYFDLDIEDRKTVVKEGDVLDLGGHRLKFILAPMVHWPEVMMSFDEATGALFSADAFGKFGASDAEEDWADEARRYYFGIVGKYGVQVQNVLKKAAALDLRLICPLHGPVLTENLGDYLALYDVWSSYRPEREGITVAYTSVYGHTAEAVRLLRDELSAKGCDVALFDLARDDMSAALASAFRRSKLVLATTTYNGDIFPFMRTFLQSLAEHGYRDRTVALIENGSWAPLAARVMKELLSGCKNLTFSDNVVTLRAAMDENNRSQIGILAEELGK